MFMLSTLKRLITANPMGMFVYAIISKWYLSIAIAGLVVTFWVFKGLEEAGVLQAAEKIVSQALADTKSVARYCVPKITNFNNFWNCLENIPEYKPTEDETKLQNSLDNLLSNPKNKPSTLDHVDPYEEGES